jgi:hypothetical protein
MGNASLDSSAGYSRYNSLALHIDNLHRRKFQHRQQAVKNQPVLKAQA